MGEDLLVTWIAPTVPSLPELTWLSEINRIQKIGGVTVTARMGNDITLDDVAAVLREPADVLVWSGHGIPGGLLLPNKVLVRTKWLAAQVSSGCRPRVAVLAACGSQLRDENLRSLSEAICRAGTTVIGFPTQATDSAAGTFTVELVRALSVNTSLAAAFDVALESIAEEQTAKGVYMTPGILDLPFCLEGALSQMQEAITRIEDRLSIRADIDSPDDNAQQKADAAKIYAGGIQSLARGGKPRKDVPVGHIHGLSASST